MFVTSFDPSLYSTEAGRPEADVRMRLVTSLWDELRPPVRDTEFKHKYPPDRELGHELDDTARVWKVYRGEAIEHDDALLKTWNDTVNILLTFAGLFSAAVTSFVIASTDDLKPDPNAYVANLLFAMGNATGDSTSSFAHLPSPPPLEAAPTSLARVVNGLWFTSLFLALAAALLCILVKQWLDEYTARTRGSAKHPRHWAQRRAFYFQGLSDWNVAAIISFLPLFLHLALFLFLAGLTAFLWSLDSIIRWVMLALISLLLTFYVVSLFIPVWSAACPYATPLLAQLRNLGYTALVGVCILRRLMHRVFSRRYAASLPTSSRNTDSESSSLESETPAPDPRMRLLLEQRARRTFERVLRRIMEKEKHMPFEERGVFAAHLDCASLQWLIHNVADSDAVAVAWQSLGALLEEPESHRFARMRTVSTELVEYMGNDYALWGTFRTDGALDDMQLGRITRSALVIASFRASALRGILYYRVPISDDIYRQDTLSPDAALICAYALSGHGNYIVEVVRRLHEQGTHRPLPSTAMFLVRQSESESLELVPEAAIGLLHYCDIGALPATAWTHVASLLGQSCTGREAIPSHECGPHCVVNALCARELQLIEDETSDSSDPRQNSAALFAAYSDFPLVVRILSAFSGFDRDDTPLSAAVWTTLTDKRYFPSPIRREDRIRPNDCARALYSLAKSSNWFYTSFATQYNSTWSRLLRGFIRNHRTVILDEGIDFDGGAYEALLVLTNALEYITPWQSEVTDPALRHARLRSALTLAESASIAICSMDRTRFPWEFSIAKIVRRIPLVSIFPADLGLTEEEHNEWVELFVSAVQHLMKLDPLPWDDLRDDVTASTDSAVKAFFQEVHARLVEVGPCTKGACARKAPTNSDWLSALGPAL